MGGASGMRGDDERVFELKMHSQKLPTLSNIANIGVDKKVCIVAAKKINRFMIVILSRCKKKLVFQPLNLMQLFN